MPSTSTPTAASRDLAAVDAPALTGADAVAAALLAANVELVFGLPGVHNMALWPALERAGIRIVGSRHEQGAAYAADGYARVTGKVGVVLTTTGPGAANTLGAVGEAWASHAPVVVIATDIATTVRRPGVYRGVLHECTDQAAMFEPVTKGQLVATHADGLAGLLGQAVQLATTAPAGPVYVGIPTDLLSAPARPVDMSEVPRTRTEPIDAALVTRAAGLLAASERPLLWIGGGARGQRDAVTRLAEALGAPAVTTYQGRGVLPSEHPLLVPAPPHEPEVTALIASSDAVVVVGSDLDAMTTQGWRLTLPRPRVAINVDAQDATKNYTMDVVLTGEVGPVIGHLLDAPISGPECVPRRPWSPSLDALGRVVRAGIAATDDTASAATFLDNTASALPPATVVFCDMAVAGYWLAGFHPVAHERGLHYPMGWGTLGFAFPAAIGSAATGRATVAFCGDGGMLFAPGELAVVAQEHLPLVTVVVDDGGYGMLRFGHADADYGTELPAPDFVQLARSFGIAASRVDGVGDDYRDALASAVASGEPRLLHVIAQLYPPRSTSPRWPLASAPMLGEDPP